MKSQISIIAGALALMTAPLSIHANAQVPKPAAAMAFVVDQPPAEWLARVFLGADVQNAAGEKIGDINDLVFDRSGRISTVVLGVGGFLGMGEKHVAVPFTALTYSSGKDGARIIVVALSKDALRLAPAFKAIEKTTMDTVMDKAVEMKNQAARKIDDMTKTAPVKQ